jgi:hypothetical protein
MHRPSAVLATVLSTLAFTATASASSYCVAPATGCDHTASSLQDALTQAATRLGDDTIGLGAATYAENGLNYNPADHARVSISGAAQDATVIMPVTSTTGTVTLEGLGGPVDLTALTVRTGTASATIGLQLQYGGNVDRVQVLAGDGANQPTGMETFSPSTITNSRFDLPGTGKCVSGGGPGTVSVLDSTLTRCNVGVQAGAHQMFAQRLRITDVVTGISVYSGTANLDDSLVKLRSSGGWGAVAQPLSAGTTETLYLNQDTILGVGSGIGAAAVNHASSGLAHVEVYDSIIRGFTTSLETDSDSGSHPADLTAAINDYDGTIAGAVTSTNPRFDDPLFVDPAHGDYHLQASSPLIDRDDYPIYTEIGESATDLDGSVRMINGKRDLGAFERPLAPGAATGPPTDITQTSATVPAAANGGGAHAAVKLVFGPTSAYGSEIALDATGADFADHTYSVALSGLSPATTYHYALVVTNSAGTTTSTDRTLTTGAPPPPVCCSPPPVAKAALGGLKISPSRFKAASKGATFAKAKTGAKVTFTLSVAGTVKFTVLRAKRVKGRTRYVKVGRTISRAAKAGVNKLRFSGRIGGKKLKPGRYRLQTVDPAGATKRVRFTILRR